LITGFQPGSQPAHHRNPGLYHQQMAMHSENSLKIIAKPDGQAK
jgi:hypothetical protein